MKKVLIIQCAVVAILFLVASRTLAQGNSKGREKVEGAYAYQAHLQDSSITVAQAIARWSSINRDPDVRADNDAHAIALGCEGLLELQRGEMFRADSLLGKAMPLFRLRKSKAYFLVAYAGLERTLHKFPLAMRAYSEIAETLDSVPDLDLIPYYMLSGYAEYAYGIDAAYGMAKIAIADSAQLKPAIMELKATLNRHPKNPLGLMCATALKYIDGDNADQYTFAINLICEQTPAYRKIADEFAKRIQQ